MPNPSKGSKQSNASHVTPSRSGHSATPPNSPTELPRAAAITPDQFNQLLDVLKLLVPGKSGSNETSPSAAPLVEGNTQPAEGKTLASKLEFKTVDEVWDKTTSKYKIVEAASLEEATEYNEYVFVIRARVDKDTSERTFYVDIKSEDLRDILRDVLRDVRGLSLKEDRIMVERDLLYHYATELETCRKELEGKAEDAKFKHLGLLVEYIKTTYTTIKSRLASNLKNSEITFDLLPFLFKPNQIIYTTILDARKPACFRYESGKEKITGKGIRYFHVACRYLNYDGQVFGESPAVLGISAFKGAKRIDQLEAFPLEFHPQQEQIREYMVKCGETFVELRGQHYLQYYGIAFYATDGGYVEVPVDSRIMVDVSYFRKVNPNYVRPAINELVRSSSSSSYHHYPVNGGDQIKSNDFDPTLLSKDDLMICCQTVYGWSFGNKQWLEFLVDCTAKIDWNPSSFDNLAIPPKHKMILLALVKASLSCGPDDKFDDFVEGKGQGLIALLHGPTGVGKTLTAEALSEYLERPLYSVSAGELGHDAKTLEKKLDQIFLQAHHWNAIVLLDEADVFMQKRSVNDFHNALVSVFLRTLEYYRGIMFLTTNRIRDFDDAIQCRISVALHYSPLGPNMRRMVWESFLENVASTEIGAKYSGEDLDWLAQKEVNGRQIKNIAKTARALAVNENKALSRSHLEIVIDLDKEFQKDYHGHIENNGY